MKPQKPQNNVLTQITNNMRRTQSRLQAVLNNQTPTAPVIDLPNNPPATAVEGQIALDELGKMWWYIDGDWRTC